MKRSETSANDTYVSVTHIPCTVVHDEASNERTKDEDTVNSIAPNHLLGSQHGLTQTGVTRLDGQHPCFHDTAQHLLVAESACTHTEELTAPFDAYAVTARHDGPTACAVHAINLKNLSASCIDSCSSSSTHSDNKSNERGIVCTLRSSHRICYVDAAAVHPTCAHTATSCPHGTRESRHNCVCAEMNKVALFSHHLSSTPDLDISLGEDSPSGAHHTEKPPTSQLLLRHRPRMHTSSGCVHGFPFPGCDSHMGRLVTQTCQHVFSKLQIACARIVPYGGLASNCFSIASVTLGGGIISMPRSFATSGIVAGVLYLVILGIMTVYTMTVMGYVLRHTGCQTFEQMATALGGVWWGHFVGFVLWISCIGAGVGYIRAVSSLIDPMITHAGESAHVPAFFRTTAGNRVLTTGVWLLCMLPAVIPRRVNSTRYVSAVGCIMVMYFVLVTVMHSCAGGGGLRKGMRGNMQYFTSGNEALYGLSIFMFGYLCQAMSHPVWLEMRPRRSVRQLTVASAIAVGVCMIFYVLVGFFGYMDFGDDTRDPVLYNFDPLHQPYIMVAYVGMLIKLVAAYAVNMIPCRNVVYDTLGWDLETVPFYKHLTVVALLSVLALILGFFIPNISTAFGLVGSLCGGFLGFIFPGLFWMYCGNWSLKTVGICHYLSTYILLISGVVAIVFGTVATIYSSFVY